MPLVRLLASAILVALCSASSCCEQPEPITLRLSYCSLGIANLDNAGEAPVLSPSNRIPRAAFGLNLALESREDICVAPLRWGNPFVATAYAAHCDPYQEFRIDNVDTVTRLSIATVADLDAAHPAGTDVTDLFRVFISNARFVTVPDFLTEDIFTQAPLAIWDESDAQQQQIALLLADAPPAGGEVQFRIRAELSDGRVLEAASPVALLL